MVYRSVEAWLIFLYHKLFNFFFVAKIGFFFSTLSFSSPFDLLTVNINTLVHTSSVIWGWAIPKDLGPCKKTKDLDLKNNYKIIVKKLGKKCKKIIK